MEFSKSALTQVNAQIKPQFRLVKVRAIAPVMATVIGLASGGWLGMAIAPQVVQAQTNPTANPVNVSLQRQPNESFETLISRAETAARVTAQRSFESSSATSVTVTVLGESAGLVAPLLSLEVSRDNWRSRPDPQQWSTYYSDARVLLGFDTPAPATATQPAPTAPTQPTATPPADPAAAQPNTPPTTTIIVPPAVPANPAATTAPGEPQQAPSEAGANSQPTPSTQQPALGNPSVGDQEGTTEAPQTQVDDPGSISTPGEIPVPEVYDPGPIGVPRSGVGN